VVNASIFISVIKKLASFSEIALIQHYYPQQYPSLQLPKSLALGKKYRLKALQKSVLKRIFNRRDRLNDRILEKTV
jgi:hypothetical protein